MATTGFTTARAQKPRARSAARGTTAIPICRSGGTLTPKGCPLRGTRGAAVRCLLHARSSHMHTRTFTHTHMRTHARTHAQVDAHTRTRPHVYTPARTAHTQLHTACDIACTIVRARAEGAEAHRAHMRMLSPHGGLPHAACRTRRTHTACGTCAHVHVMYRLLHVVRHELRARQLEPRQWPQCPVDPRQGVEVYGERWAGGIGTRARRTQLHRLTLGVGVSRDGPLALEPASGHTIHG